MFPGRPAGVLRTPQHAPVAAELAFIGMNEFFLFTKGDSHFISGLQHPGKPFVVPIKALR
jgi:hypothetical protein